MLDFHLRLRKHLAASRDQPHAFFEMLDGILQPLPKNEQSSAPFELVSPETDHLQHRICLVDPADLKVDHLQHKPVKVFGREQWRKGERFSVVTATRIERIW